MRCVLVHDWSWICQFFFLIKLLSIILELVTHTGRRTGQWKAYYGTIWNIQTLLRSWCWWHHRYCLTTRRLSGKSWSSRLVAAHHAGRQPITFRSESHVLHPPCYDISKATRCKRGRITDIRAENGTYSTFAKWLVAMVKALEVLIQLAKLKC